MRASRPNASRRWRKCLNAGAVLVAVCYALPPRMVSADDGTWSEWDPPSNTPAFHSAVYDPLRGELVVLPSSHASNGREYWTMSLAGLPSWTRHYTGLPAPAPRTSGAFVVRDSKRDRIILVGGVGTPSTGVQPYEVWALSLASGTWTKLLPSVGTIRSINGAAGVYDPGGDRIVAYHNWGAPGSGEVWMLPLGSAGGWQQLSMGTAYPANSHTAVYDTLRHRMLVFGGTPNGVTDPASPLAINLQGPPYMNYLATTGTPPPVISNPSAVYDPVGDRMLVYGGTISGCSAWALSLSGTPTWTQLTSGAATDPAQILSGVAFVPERNQVIVFGGMDKDNYSNDCWALDLNLTPSWVPLTGVHAVETPGRRLHSALADPVRDRMLVFGGWAQLGWGVYWSYELWSHGWSADSEWEKISTLGPAPRYDEPLAYDSSRDRLLGFSMNAVVALPLPGSGTHHWTNLSPTGTAPSTRVGVALAYDPAADRLLVFGGSEFSSSSTLHDELWSVNLSGTPAWSKVGTSEARPSGRTASRFVLDAKRGRLLLVGGTSGTVNLSDVWQLSLGSSPQWTQLAPSGTPPAGAVSATMDTLEDRLLVLSGTRIFVLPLSGTLAWTELAPVGRGPATRGGASLVFDHARHRAVMFGGAGTLAYLNDCWSVQFTPPSAAVPSNTQDALRLAAWPNPARGHLDVSFTLPRAGRVRLELADIAGRRVRQIDAGQLEAGSHALRLDAGAQLPAGLYFATLRTAEGTRSAKVVIAQ